MHAILTEDVKYVESYSISKFEKEIESMNCIYQVLRSFIRYSSRTQDSELTAIAAVRKMQEILD
jgi:hypothetical protein